MQEYHIKGNGGIGIMSDEEMKVLARQGIKMTHIYFTDKEYLTMQGNKVLFEDGVKILWDDWFEDKEWLEYGWSRFDKEESGC